MHTHGPLFVYAGIFSNRVSGGYTGGGKQGLRVECLCSSSPVCLLGALTALHRQHRPTGDGGGSPRLLYGNTSRNTDSPRGGERVQAYLNIVLCIKMYQTMKINIAQNDGLPGDHFIGTSIYVITRNPLKMEDGW